MKVSGGGPGLWAGGAARTADVLQFEGGSGGQDRLGDPGEEGSEAAGAATEA